LTIIAISYRRDDTGAISGRIYDRLRQHYGQASVFMDIDAIPPGKDFRDHIKDTIDHCDALIAIVGDRWLGRKKAGARIAEDSDWVRIELEIAFRNNIPVVPVLIGQAIMPRANQLPESIRNFAFLQAAKVDSGADFHPHMDRLIHSLDVRIESSRPVSAPTPPLPTNPSSNDATPFPSIRQALDPAAGASAAIEDNRVLSRFAGVVTTARGHASKYLSAADIRLPGILRRRSRGYWIGAVLVLALAMIASPYADDYLNLAQLRRILYQQLSQWQPDQIRPRDTKVLSIEDADYWYGEPQGRRPINRSYLAKLVDALDKAGAKVIALDIDPHLPDADAKGTPGDFNEIQAAYRDETEDLIRSIVHAAANRKMIVLPRSLKWNADRTGYFFRTDFYQPYGICTGFDQLGRWLNPGTRRIPIPYEAQSNIACGYIGLPVDMSMLPPPLAVGRTHLDSFALAIARAFYPESAARLGSGTYYVRYATESALAAAHARFSAGDLLRAASGVTTALKNEAVIIGGHWHAMAPNEGNLVDFWPTPIGLLSGSVIHENYVETAFADKNYEYMPDWILGAFEFIFGLTAILVFACFSTTWSKLVALSGMLALFVLIQWVMLYTLGTFFDGLVVLSAIWLHSLLARGDLRRQVYRLTAS